MNTTFLILAVIAVGFFAIPKAFSAQNEVYQTSVIDPFFYVGARIGLRTFAPAYDATEKLKEKNSKGLFKNFHLVEIQTPVKNENLKVQGLTTLKLTESRAGRRHVMFYYGVGGNMGRILHEELFLLNLQTLLGPNTDISLIDYPGYGISEGAANELTIIAAAKVALEYFDSTYHLGGESILIGHSLGSAVTLQVAAARPLLFQKFVLLNPFYQLADSASFAIALTKDRYRSYQYAPLILKSGFVTGGKTDTIVKENSSAKLAEVFQAGTIQYWANPYDHVAPILEDGDLEAFDDVWSPVLSFLDSAQ
jgi:pimeloyl-ACP methyl ester carboxylesterase